MSAKPLLFVVCTMLNELDFAKQSETYKFFDDNKLVATEDYVVFYENRAGLSSVYNKFLNNTYKDKIVVFVHDDVKLGYNLETLKRELNIAHKSFDIIGLAGATKLRLDKPCLWHIMASSASGSVGHSINGNYQMSNYGPSPQKCIIVDGLFISVNTERVIGVGHKFDERFNFHHYDLDFCIQADKCGLKVGTWPIWVTHLSPGLTSMEKSDYRKSESLFCQKYDIT